jgi:hypothetical protein
MIFIAYNHNGVEISRNADLGNLMEEVMIYEEVTGNRCTVDVGDLEAEKVAGDRRAISQVEK